MLREHILQRSVEKSWIYQHTCTMALLYSSKNAFTVLSAFIDDVIYALTQDVHVSAL